MKIVVFTSFLTHFSLLHLRKDRASKWWNNYWALFLVWLFHFCGNLGGTIRGKLLFNYLLVSPILKFSVSTVSHPEQLLNRYLNRGFLDHFNWLKTNPLFHKNDNYNNLFYPDASCAVQLFEWTGVIIFQYLGVCWGSKPYLTHLNFWRFTRRALMHWEEKMKHQ